MINYRGTPLFGEDSSVSHTSEFFAIAGTVLFWLLFLIFSLVIKPQVKKQYKEVQIVLSSTPVVQKTEEAPAPAEAASASAASESAVSTETPVREVAKVQPVVDTAPAPKSQSTPKKVESPKTTTKKAETQKQATKTSTTQPPAPTPIYKTNEQLLEEQLKNKRTPKENYDPWANETEEDVFTQDENRRVVNNQNTMSGSAGNAAAKGSDDKIKSEQTENKTNDNVTQGDNLNTIRNSKEVGTSESGDGKSKEKSNGKDTNSVIWTEGTGARTYYKLDTELSQKAKSSMLVTKDTPFTITFSVDSDGNVLATSIEIKNEFILSEIIKNEMKDKISKWKFGKGTGISKAQFDWILRPGN